MDRFFQIRRKVIYFLGILISICLLKEFSLNAVSDDEVFLIEEEPVDSVIHDLESDFNKEELFKNSDAQREEYSLPRAYDGRSIGVVPKVRNQKIDGPCWTFATIAGLETDAIKKGIYASDNIDLSERHLLYYSCNTQNDIMNGLEGDVISSSTDYLKTMGNVSIAAHTLINWKGAVDEKTAPYDLDWTGPENSVECAFNNDVLHLMNMRCYSMQGDEVLIKKEIMKHGSAMISMYYSRAYEDKVSHAYYCNRKVTTNHAVAVVGWDDDYSKDNFSLKPSADGAWIIRNSYGTAENSEGYFYLSYEDASIGPNAYIFDVSKSDNYDNQYQYDGTVLDTKKIIGNNSIKIANVYTAKASPTEKIEAVGFYTNMVNLNYEIQIYVGGGQENPESGTSALSRPIIGTTDATGYYMIPIVEDVSVVKGHRFSIVIKLSKDNSSISVPIEGTRRVGTLNSEASAKKGESFVNANGTWKDFGESYNSNLRIKAYTVNADASKLPSAAEESDISAFVSRLYTIFLDRKPDEEGKVHWATKLKSGDISAATLVEGFACSEEFKNKSLSNSEMIERMYEAMLDRESDTEGKVYWVDRLENGMTLRAIITGFSGSIEFENLCKEYGINPGSLEDGEPRDINPGVTGFVSRCYTKALGREFDIEGLNYWCNKILSSKKIKETAVMVATNGFFHSEEFVKKNYSDSNYIKILYRTFLGREYDEEGFKYWTEQLKEGVSKEEVLAGFADSIEFAQIMSTYGIR